MICSTKIKPKIAITSKDYEKLTKFDVKDDERSSNSLISLWKYSDILLLPNSEKQSKLKYKSDYEVHNGDKKQCVVFFKLECISKKEVEIAKVPSSVYSYCVKGKPFSNKVLIWGCLCLADHFVDEEDSSQKYCCCEICDWGFSVIIAWKIYINSEAWWEATLASWVSHFWIDLLHVTLEVHCEV